MPEMSNGAGPTIAEPHRLSLVVGVGASAGGIQALTEFFAHVRPGSGIAYVVILHLSPDYESKLAEVLQRVSPIRVTQVTEKVRIEPDHAYVVPQNRTLSMVDGHITVTPITRAEQRRASVDLFFRALADSHGSRSAAVVLSGTGLDGSAGIKRVKEYGGLTIAQDPAEADHAEMPRNSIATGLVDLVLPVAQVPGRIAEYADRMRNQAISELEETGAVALGEDDAMREVLTVLRVRTGHDFSNYKAATLQRRVQRRIHLRGLPTLRSYARMVREQPDEAVALMRELLISVTNFFRDPAAFDALASRVIPRLFDAARPHEEVRVWVAGCATGEEAYSIAMLLAEHVATGPERPPIQIFGSDLDEHAIAAAREGFYTQTEVADVSEQRLQRFFVKENGGYRVRRELREMLLFAHHNLIKDPPFSHLDLIVCRNMLIYLNRPVQERVIERFHFALRPGRYLFLGGSESADGTDDLFLAVDRDAHIYESRTVTTRIGLVSDGHFAPPRVTAHAVPRAAERMPPSELHQRLLEQYAPPSLVVTEGHMVVHMSERVGRFLQVAGGEPTGDVMRMIRPELRADLRVVLHEAARQRRPVEARHVRVPFDGQDRLVTVHVRPALRAGDPPRGFFLVVFEESDAAGTDAGQPVRRIGSAASPQLEEEITRLKEQLRVTIEQYETQVEEGKASNEELQAMNEELRSSAEELETSKEELQSLNEEMTTVNQELKVKIDELGLTNNDFQNLINSSEVGTIFLDRSLRVKLSTPSARRVFNLLQSDIGRPLSDITSHILYPGVHEDVGRVLADLRIVEHEVETRDGRWHLMRIRPYRTLDDRIDGVVLTFQDITERHAAEGRVRAAEERLRMLLDSAIDYAIVTLNREGRIDSWNTGAQHIFGHTAEEAIGQPVEALFTPEDRLAGVPAQELERAARDGRADDERFHIRKSGERFYSSGVTTRLPAEGGGGFAKIARDLTEQRRAADATTLLHKVVTSQEDERARIARDLHDQLGQQLTALRLTLERLANRHQGDDQVASAISLAHAIDAELGFLAWELRPAVLDDLGLGAALPRYVREWSEHYGIAAEFRSAGFEAGRLTRESEVAFYRIAQEALNNVAKHAHASRVDVMLESRDRGVVLVVEDDGVGFNLDDVTRSALGLGGMRERAALIAASLQIETAPGKGTSVFLRCPAK